MVVAVVLHHDGSLEVGMLMVCVCWSGSVRYVTLSCCAEQRCCFMSLQILAFVTSAVNSVSMSNKEYCSIFLCGLARSTAIYLTADAGVQVAMISCSI